MKILESGDVRGEFVSGDFVEWKVVGGELVVGDFVGYEVVG